MASRVLGNEEYPQAGETPNSTVLVVDEDHTETCEFCTKLRKVGYAGWRRPCFVGLRARGAIHTPIADPTVLHEPGVAVIPAPAGTHTGCPLSRA